MHEAERERAALFEKERVRLTPAEPEPVVKPPVPCLRRRLPAARSTSRRTVGQVEDGGRQDRSTPTPTKTNSTDIVGFLRLVSV